MTADLNSCLNAGVSSATKDQASLSWEKDQDDHVIDIEALIYARVGLVAPFFSSYAGGGRISPQQILKKINSNDSLDQDVITVYSR